MNISPIIPLLTVPLIGKISKNPGIKSSLLMELNCIKTSRRSESRHRRRSSRTPSHSSRSSHRSKENETYRNYPNYNSNTPNREQQKRKGPDELEIVLYVLFVIWLFLITSALLRQLFCANMIIRKNHNSLLSIKLCNTSFKVLSAREFT